MTDVFRQNTGGVSRKYELLITPAGWTFAIWGFIYTWNALWLVYGVSTIFRRNPNGVFIYQLDVTPPSVYMAFTVCNLFNIAWLFTWDREELLASVFLIALTPFMLYVALVFSHVYLNRNISFLDKNYMPKEKWLVRGLVQNGLAFYATWTTIATLINFAITLSYYGDVAVKTSSTVALSILTVELLAWVSLDILFFDNYTRYSLTPYITVVVALSGVVSKNYNLDTNRQNSVFALILLIFAVIFFVLKLFVTIWRHLKKDIVVPTLA